MISERDDLLRQRTTLHTQIKDNKGAVSELQRKLAALASELELNARQLKYGQATCGTLPPARRTRSSRRRSFRRIGLMRFLEEVRTKVVELIVQPASTSFCTHPIHYPLSSFSPPQLFRTLSDR